jgi:hypothetical protein
MSAPKIDHDPLTCCCEYAADIETRLKNLRAALVEAEKQEDGEVKDYVVKAIKDQISGLEKRSKGANL